jgi:hypothetical protein
LPLAAGHQQVHTTAVENVSTQNNRQKKLYRK